MLRFFYLAIIVFFFNLMPFNLYAQSEEPFINLTQLIEEALQNNPGISAVKKKWKVFEEKGPQASALEDPMFSFGIVNISTNFRFKDEDMTKKGFFS